MIYLDNHATTFIDPRVLSAMLPYLQNSYGNPASRSHSYGWDAEEAVDNAREKVANLINADPNEIIFTSGATEANNMIFNMFSNQLVYISNLEHSSVAESAKYFCNYQEIFSDLNGIIDVNTLKDLLIEEKCALISVMMVNNEIGTIQLIKELKKICPNIPFHSDMAQALGKVKVNVKELGIEYASFSAHKVYGPKGIGALYIKEDSNISRFIHGGAQEFGLRAGTLNVPGIVGFGKACEIATKECDIDKITNMSKLLTLQLKELVPNIIFHNFEPKVANNLHMVMPCEDMDAFMAKLSENVAVSSGSACMSIEDRPSKVLEAVNISEEEARRSIRIGIGRFNTEKEMYLAARYVAGAIEFAKGG